MCVPGKVDQWSKYIQSLLYPPRCLLCGTAGESGRNLCSGCLADMPHNAVACGLCALPLTGHEEGVCGACLKRPPSIDGSTIPFLYAPPMDHLLLRLKFSRQLVNAALLGELMADAIVTADNPLPDTILPVPLHRKRLRERGYNQALELARPVARRLGIGVEKGLVVRTRHTDAQSSLEKAARRKNIKGAFEVVGTPPAHIAILDDVVTTGSTVNELATALRRAGAKRVVVWACARVR